MCNPLLSRRLGFVAAALVVALPTPAVIAAPAVAYTVTARTRTWMPIRMPDVAAAVRERVVATLSRGGLLRLSAAVIDPRTKRARTAGADMRLDIEAEVIEEAGSFNVALTLRPLRQTSWPTFAAATTTVIARVAKPEMLRRISDAALRAARRLRASVERSFKATAGRVDAAKMFDWGKLAPPAVTASSADLALWLNRRAPVDKRRRAGERLSAHAYDDPNVRHALERVALADASWLLRYYAVRYLKPASRRYPFTQRVLLAVARDDGNPKVRQAALTLSDAFVGRSVRDTVQTWIVLLTTKIAELDSSMFGAIVKRLEPRVDAPNLDEALTGCLRQTEVLRGGRDRKRRCLDLVRRLPGARRTAVLQRYLDRPLSDLRDDLPERSGRASGPYAAAVRLIGDGCASRRVDQMLARHVREANAPAVTEAVMRALASGRASTRRAKLAAGMLRDSADERSPVRSAALSALGRAAQQRHAPWAVHALKGVSKILTALAQHPRLTASESRRLARYLASIKTRQEQPHINKLRAHVDGAGRPRPSAVAYFAACVRNAKETRPRRDCLSGLGWLAEHGALRARALAAFDALRRAQIGDAVERSIAWQLRRLQSPRRRPAATCGVAR